jgi:Nucleoside-diphosphate-sugar epimerases
LRGARPSPRNVVARTGRAAARPAGVPVRPPRRYGPARGGRGPRQKGLFMRRILVTGTAGFIGFHLARLLLAEGFRVHGYDGMTDYYDVALKRRRHAMLLQDPNFSATEGMLEDQALFDRVADEFAPEVIVHLAAQAGVRYSVENPRAYLDANVIGSFTVMEAARRLKVAHLMMASTSSVYGANEEMPFRETDKADRQLTIYAATKKANESMGHAWAHVHGLPITMFRFFTVYGPWGRPDLALFRFVEAILEDRPIEIYNHGEMWRDFTYVDDLVRAIRLLIEAVPGGPETAVEEDSLSPAAPFRIVNIGNSDKVRLLDFVEAIEESLGRRAIRSYLPMQVGDVPATWADAGLLQRLTGYRPQTDIRDGIAQFVSWYRDYTGK